MAGGSTVHVKMVYQLYIFARQRDAKTENSSVVIKALKRKGSQRRSKTNHYETSTEMN